MRKFLGLVGLLAVLLIGAVPAHAAFPGQNGKIAFETDAGGNSDIWVMDPDGSNRVQLTTDPASDLVPAWSPDGTKIAFRSNRDGNFEIYVMNADGSGQTRLTSNTAADTDPAWSPDGTKIVFTRSSQMIVMNSDGTGEAPLTGGLEPAWSPDGTKIAFTDGFEINVINPDGTGRVQVTPTGDPGCGGGDPGRETTFSPNWAPGGRAIAFLHLSPVDEH
jgi:Tol biopolymer transport system component